MSRAVVFISYAHADNENPDPAKRWLDRLHQHLAPLAFDDIVAVATDRDIALGDDWHARIQADLERAHAVVLLVSPAFLASHYIRNHELPVLLRRAKERGLKIVPVLLRPSLFAQTRFRFPDPKHGPEEFTLASLQAAGSPGQALNEMGEGEQDRALLGVAQCLLAYAEERAGAVPPTVPPVAPAVRVDLSHLPDGAQHLFGRDKELAELDAAWASAGGTRIVELVAPGGVGKTSLVKEWLQRLDHAGWGGATRVYGWSFYSQGTGDDRQASEDGFLSAALAWFQVPHDPALHPSDKGRKLAEAVAATRSLLVLDGVEPLQYPPGPLAGELRAPGLKALLQHLAGAGQPGLCLITSRERLTDLDQYERNGSRPNGAVLRRDLGNLGDGDGARLLHALGAKRAGAGKIGPDDDELRAASRAVKGHALTLSLLGRYLALAYDGDIRRRDQVDFHEADAEIQGGHAFKVMAAYEAWFAREGEPGARQLAALRLLGFFDRPAGADSLSALRAAPAIPGLTEPLADLGPAQWRITLKRLEECGLVYPGEEDDGALDAHPLVREYLAKTLRERQPEAWREGHRRLYEQLKASVPHRPEGLAALQPLYQAVAHGCLAGLYEEALDEGYVDRILRGTEQGGFYSTKKLGAYGADLGAVACFFAEPWRRPVPALAEADQAWLLGMAAFRLRALGRLDEALEPMRAGVEVWVKQQGWKNTAVSYGNLSELQLSLGRVAAAVAAAENAVKYAERSGDAFPRITTRAGLADALHQQGKVGAAIAGFREAEALQADDLPEYPLLYSLPGFQYCDLLLAGAERAAWRGQRDAASIRRCGEVAERGRKMFDWRVPDDSILGIALDHLTLGRCALYAALLQGQPPHAAQTDIDRAVAGLDTSGQQDYLLRGLLTRAWLRHRLGNPAGARTDLDDAERIAARGNMKLHLADIHLTRARLFGDPTELAAARSLIEACGYGRRLPELADAEAALSVPLRQTVNS